MDKKKKKKLICIIVAAVLLAAGIIIKHTIGGPAVIVLLIPAYVIVGYGPIIKAAKNISHGQIFDENFLMAIATVGALALGEYDEAVAVMLFYQIGEFFEDYAVDKSRKSVAALMDIRPDFAVVLKDDREETVDPYDVNIGDTVLVKPGEKIPLDGTVIEGNSSVDTSSLTGEALPKDVEAGDEVISGCINLSGVIKIKVTSMFEESTVSKILEMVENASSRKAPVENFITKFAKYYTPVVVFSAVALAIIPPLVIADATFSTWIYRALLFLVVSCPCALVISIPMSFFSGIGAASARGVLVKGGNYLQILSKVNTVIFDKTGTLTTGKFKVDKIYGDNPDELLALAAACEQYSNHPIAVSIKEAYKGDIYTADDVQEIAGRGIKATIDGKEVYAGNAKLMHELNISNLPEITGTTLVHLAYSDKYLGYISVTDTIKEDTAEGLKALKDIGVTDLVMLTGDNRETAEKVAEQAGITEVHANLLPENKVEIAEQIIDKGRITAFVGDGVNDAPVLARVDAGIAMGGLGSAAAMEAADVVIMDDNPKKISLAIRIGRKTVRLAKENIWFALIIKLLVLVLGALGLVNMWAAVFADVGVAVIAIANSMRALRVK
ncbi:MAG: heavy metal translocating P-type ATPase [Anaerovoracaceae bacterium]|nr:heavy metal translocating P-type ATPase [Anaerovoracaceae bacterium]